MRAAPDVQPGGRPAPFLMFGSSSVFRGFKCLLQVPVRMGARGASVLQFSSPYLVGLNTILLALVLPIAARRHDWLGLRTPWKPALTQQEQQRAIYAGSGTRMRRVADKLLDGRPISVYFLGGSITHLQDSSDWSGGAKYPQRLYQFINFTFPHRLHKFVDRSYPATPASYAMPCVESLVAADADVVVVEYTMNENRTAEFDSLERREYEQLLRRVLRLPGQPAVVLLHSYAWLLAAGDGVTEGLFYTNTEGQLATLAQFYDVPSLSLRAAVWQLMQAGIDGFKVDKVSGQAFTSHLTGRTVPAAAKREADGYFYMDGAHPTAAGHLAMAELLAGLFSRAVLDATSGLALHSRTDDRLTVLPPAMIPNNPDQPTAFCAMMEEFQHVVKAHAGFEYKALNPNAAGFAAQKWGWLATRPGSYAQLEIDTRSGVKDNKGNALVRVVYLQSWVNPGVASVTCTSGCTCLPGKLNTTNPVHNSLFRVFPHKVSQHAKCRMQFKVILAPNKQADEEQRVLLVAVSVIHRA